MHRIKPGCGVGLGLNFCCPVPYPLYPPVCGPLPYPMQTQVKTAYHLKSEYHARPEYQPFNGGKG